MDDTAFHVSADKLDRFTGNYARPDGTLQLTDSPVNGQHTRPPVWLSGGGGLTSTASDYIRFAQMLLHGGELDGVRILETDTVETIRTNHLPESLIPVSFGTYLSPAYGFGLGFAVLVDDTASPKPDNTGVHRWAGAANTFFWIDPASGSIRRRSSSGCCGRRSARSPSTTSSGSSRRWFTRRCSRPVRPAATASQGATGPAPEPAADYCLRSRILVSFGSMFDRCRTARGDALFQAVTRPDQYPCRSRASSASDTRNTSRGYRR